MIPKQISEIEVPQATGKIETWKARVATAIVSREHRATWLPASALLILIGYFAFQQPAFLSPLNLTVMGAQAGPLLLISLGATFIVLMGSIDLSVAAVAALASAISAVLLQKFGTGYTTALLRRARFRHRCRPAQFRSFDSPAAAVVHCNSCVQFHLYGHHAARA